MKFLYITFLRINLPILISKLLSQFVNNKYPQLFSITSILMFLVTILLSIINYVICHFVINEICANNCVYNVTIENVILYEIR